MADHNVESSCTLCVPNHVSARFQPNTLAPVDLNVFWQFCKNYPRHVRPGISAIVGDFPSDQLRFLSQTRTALLCFQLILGRVVGAGHGIFHLTTGVSHSGIAQTGSGDASSLKPGAEAGRFGYPHLWTVVAE